MSESEEEATYDAAVVGLGGMGSAAAAHLAARGARTVGFEAFARGHELGASAGRSRIIRKAYFEDPAYVPLLERAYQLWSELERETGLHLFEATGVLIVGRPESAIVRGAAASARQHGIACERYDAGDLARRYPAVRAMPFEVGLFEPYAGVLFPELAIEAHLRVAERRGAELRFETPVVRYRSEGGCVALDLRDGSTVRARSLVLCAGPWTAPLIADARVPIRVQRNVAVWFTPRVRDYDAGRFPAFLIERAGWRVPLYGFPDFGEGVKAAFHALGEDTTAASLDRSIREDDISLVRGALETWMPGAAGEFAFAKACMYALTPDEHFIIDVLPSDSRIVVAGGFSGHGFKFCTVVGEVLADLATGGRTRHPIGFLRLGRFADEAGVTV